MRSRHLSDSPSLPDMSAIEGILNTLIPVAQDQRPVASLTFADFQKNYGEIVATISLQEDIRSNALLAFLQQLDALEVLVECMQETYQMPEAALKEKLSTFTILQLCYIYETIQLKAQQPDILKWLELESIDREQRDAEPTGDSRPESMNGAEGKVNSQLDAIIRMHPDNQDIASAIPVLKSVSNARGLVFWCTQHISAIVAKPEFRGALEIKLTLYPQDQDTKKIGDFLKYMQTVTDLKNEMHAERTSQEKVRIMEVIAAHMASKFLYDKDPALWLSTIERIMEKYLPLKDEKGFIREDRNYTPIFYGDPVNSMQDSGVNADIKGLWEPAMWGELKGSGLLDDLYEYYRCYPQYRERIVAITKKFEAALPDSYRVFFGYFSILQPSMDVIATLEKQVDPTNIKKLETILKGVREEGRASGNKVRMFAAEAKKDPITQTESIMQPKETARWLQIEHIGSMQALFQSGPIANLQQALIQVFFNEQCQAIKKSDKSAEVKNFEYEAFLQDTLHELSKRGSCQAMPDNPLLLPLIQQLWHALEGALCKIIRDAVPNIEDVCAHAILQELCKDIDRANEKTNRQKGYQVESDKIAYMHLTRTQKLTLIDQIKNVMGKSEDPALLLLYKEKMFAFMARKEIQLLPLLITAPYQQEEKKSETNRTSLGKKLRSLLETKKLSSEVIDFYVGKILTTEGVKEVCRSNYYSELEERILSVTSEGFKEGVPSITADNEVKQIVAKISNTYTDIFTSYAIEKPNQQLAEKLVDAIDKNTENAIEAKKWFQAALKSLPLADIYEVHTRFFVQKDPSAALRHLLSVYIESLPKGSPKPSQRRNSIRLQHSVDSILQKTDILAINQALQRKEGMPAAAEEKFLLLPTAFLQAISAFCQEKMSRKRLETVKSVGNLNELFGTGDAGKTFSDAAPDDGPNTAKGSAAKKSGKGLSWLGLDTIKRKLSKPKSPNPWGWQKDISKIDPIQLLAEEITAHCADIVSKETIESGNLKTSVQEFLTSLPEKARKHVGGEEETNTPTKIATLLAFHLVNSKKRSSLKLQDIGTVATWLKTTLSDEILATLCIPVCTAQLPPTNQNNVAEAKKTAIALLGKAAQAKVDKLPPAYHDALDTLLTFLDAETLQMLATTSVIKQEPVPSTRLNKEGVPFSPLVTRNRTISTPIVRKFNKSDDPPLVVSAPTFVSDLNQNSSGLVLSPTSLVPPAGTNLLPTSDLPTPAPISPTSSKPLPTPPPRKGSAISPNLAEEAASGTLPILSAAPKPLPPSKSLPAAPRPPSPTPRIPPAGTNLLPTSQDLFTPAPISPTSSKPLPTPPPRKESAAAQKPLLQKPEKPKAQSMIAASLRDPALSTPDGRAVANGKESWKAMVGGGGNKGAFLDTLNSALAAKGKKETSEPPAPSTPPGMTP